MTLTADLDPLQSAVMRALVPGSVVVAAMGRGTGKTFLDRLAIHSQALSRPGLSIGLLMPSLKQARMVFWPALRDDCAGSLKGFAKPNLSELTIEYSNGSRLSTWGLENAHSIRGQRFGFVVSDETDDIDPATETAVVQPTFSRSGRNAMWLKSGTPRRGRHGILYRDFELGRKRFEVAGLRYRSFRFRSDESPQVDQVWLAAMRQVTNPAVFAREYDCNFDSGEGLIYPFEEEFHVRTPPPYHAFRKFIVGVDHGQSDPGVMLLLGIQGHGNDAVVWVLKEWYETHVANSEWDRRAREWSFAEAFHCDPSRPDRIDDMRRNAGVNSIKADNNILGGIARVSDLMFKREVGLDGNPWARMFFSPEVPNTIREVNNYRRKRDPHNADQFLESPIGKDDHALDALRYACVGEFGRGESTRGEVDGS